MAFAQATNSNPVTAFLGYFQDEATKYGYLAYTFCKLDLPLQVLLSGAGYYIGTINEEGPVSRESDEYFPTREHALQALATNSFHQRKYP